MKSTIQPLTHRSAWKDLAAHQKKIKGLHLRQLFAADPERGERLAAEAVGLFLDCLKNRVTAETLRLLLKMAAESRLRAQFVAQAHGTSGGFALHRGPGGRVRRAGSGVDGFVGLSRRLSQRVVVSANLIQARRDYFGAHTYKRNDAKGTFHTELESGI